MMASKNHKKHFLDNKGYSLVELIIVIGIIVVMTAIATVTVTLINSAKAKEAAVTFTSELSDTHTKSKNQMVVIVDEATGVTNEQPTYNYCLKVYNDGSKCYLQKGFYNPVTDVFILAPDNPNDGKGTSLSSKIQIKYQATGGTEKTLATANSSTTLSEVLIVFDRNGRCIEGDGTYNFYKKNGNLVSTVDLMKNGSFQTD